MCDDDAIACPTQQIQANVWVESVVKEEMKRQEVQHAGLNLNLFGPAVRHPSHTSDVSTILLCSGMFKDIGASILAPTIDAMHGPQQ